MAEPERGDGKNLVDSSTTDDFHVSAAKRLRPLPNEERAASNLEVAQFQTDVASENIPTAAYANAEADLSKRARSEMSQVGPSAASGNIPSAAPANAASDLQAAKSYMPLCLGVTEDRLRAMAATMDSAKRACPPSTPLPDPRAWSATSGNADRCSIFTIRAFLGDPDIQLPPRIKALKKSDLQSMMQRSGFTDISGGKDALLHRFQTGIPFLQYRIDGRECLQRVLVVCLDSWGYDDSHLFRASMPFRGACPWGAKRLRDLDSLCDLNFGGHHFLDALSNERERENWINRKLKNQRYLGSEVDRPTLEALLDRRVGLDDAAPYRTVDGTGFEPGRVGKGFDRDFSNDVGGALSLNDCALAAGDRISMCYDFGDSNTIVFKIVTVDTNQQLLPEATMLRRHATRACVDQRGGARVKSQYASARQYGGVGAVDYDEDDE